ncbi:MAG: hypothetical protein LBU65_05610 [Planctomycetaceae bacterium]|jgi:predicted esterase|nr:hypothetical protein [Planctomycetaceae bacterium]
MQKHFISLCFVALCLTFVPRVTAEGGKLSQDQIESMAMQPANGKVLEVMLPLFNEETLHYTAGTKYKDKDIKYRLRVPEKLEEGKKYPLVLWLHGVGEDGDDNKKSLVHLHHILPYLTGEKQRDFFLLVPQCPKDDYWYSARSNAQDIEVSLESWIGVNKHGIQVPVNYRKIPWYLRMIQGGEDGIDAVPIKQNKEQTVRQTYARDNGQTIRELTLKIDKDGKPEELTLIERVTKEDGEPENKSIVDVKGEQNVRKAYRDFCIEQFRSAIAEHYGGSMTFNVEETDNLDTVKVTYAKAFEDSPFGYSFAMIDDVLKRYPVDADRISVSGLSSGGDGTWAALEAKPELFAAGVPIVSWRTWEDEVLTEKPLLKKIPVWSIYSSDDSSIDVARGNFERAEAAGCNVKKTEFGICGHNGWTPAMLQADVFSFLISRGKKDGEYVQVSDPTVKPEDMKGIVEVATRDTRQPKLAPLNTNINPASAQPDAQPVVSAEENVDVITSDGETVQGKIIDDCDRPWAMTSDSQYGLFAADWMNESKDLPQFAIDEAIEDLAKRYAKSISGDGTDVAETCRAIMSLEHKPASNPFFTVTGGRLQSEINYTLSDKGKMLVRILKLIQESNEDKNSLKPLAEKTLARVEAICK